MYEYLLADFLLFLFWLFVFWLQKGEFRKAMLASGLLYSGLLVPIFFLHKTILSFWPLSPLYNPGYWKNVTTLFDLSNRSGGLSLEDLLFQFFWGGLAAIFYEWLLRKNLTKEVAKGSHVPIFVFLISYLGFSLTGINPIYLLIFPSFLGALSIYFIRRDLIFNSFFSAGVFTLVYFFCFSIFNFIYPQFVSQHYNLEALSGIIVYGVPVEDLFYAFSFSLMWGPIYKVVRGLRVVSD